MLVNSMISKLQEEYNIIADDLQLLERVMYRQNYLVEDNEGNKYYVKYYSQVLGVDEVVKITDTYRYLIDNGVNTSVVLKNVKTGNYFFIISNRIYVVFRYLEGKEATMESMRQVSKALRTFHDIKLNDSKMLFNKSITRIENARSIASRLDSPSLKKFTDFISEVKDDVEQLISNAYPINDFFIHGDFNKHNVIVNNEVINFIDCDETRIGNPLEDLASMIYSLLYINGEISYENSKYIVDFLESYYESELDQKLIDEIEVVLKVNSVIYLLDRADTYKFLARDKSTKKFLDSSITILKEKSIMNRIFKRREG